MKTDILGIKIDQLTQQQALAEIEKFLSLSGRHQIITANPEIVLESLTDGNYRQIPVLKIGLADYFHNSGFYLRHKLNFSAPLLPGGFAGKNRRRGFAGKNLRTGRSKGLENLSAGSGAGNSGKN